MDAYSRIKFTKMRELFFFWFISSSIIVIIEYLLLLIGRVVTLKELIRRDHIVENLAIIFNTFFMIGFFIIIIYALFVKPILTTIGQ